MLRPYTRALRKLFRTTSDKHDAQHGSRSILLDMAADDRVLSAALAQHIATPGKLNTRNFPSLGFEIAKSPAFVLVANAFFPHPDGSTTLTFNSVHHHGDMLLTTVTAFGPGYEHWVFTRPAVLDPDRDLFRIGLHERASHPRGHIAFVDAHIPHAVMFPPSLTITYALWSSQHRVRWLDYVKRIELIQRRAKTLRSLAAKLGLRRALDLKLAEYFDYYPRDGAFCGMRERQQFERGPNEDYLQSLFSILQATGNEALARDVERRIDAQDVEEVPTAKDLITRMRRGETIPPKFSERIHLGIPHMNFEASAILRNVA